MPSDTQVAESEVYESCGNVFADLGLPEPEIHLAKAQLVHGMSTIIKSHGLTLGKTAKILELPVAKLKGILKGNFFDYSIEQLLMFNTLLGQNVHFTFTPTKGSHLNGSFPRKIGATLQTKTARKGMLTRVS